MRHVLGVLGVLAAGVLLAVSAAMNWRFGFSLGRTELDGQIYGAASAAADCLKALVPFFFFAAVRNKVWSQAFASALVWVVVTAYAMTSALGHAALNRFDSTGHRAQEAQTYKDLRTDLKRAEEEAGWIPQHRPYLAVQSEIDGLKMQKAWKWSNGCTDVNSKTERTICNKYTALNAELASASAAKTADGHIAQLRAQLDAAAGTPALSEADPQAKVLTELATTFFPGVKIENVQMALTLFVALLLEVGSGFGMYVAFSQWRLYDRPMPVAPKLVLAEANPAAAAVAAPVLTPVAVQRKSRVQAPTTTGRSRYLSTYPLRWRVQSKLSPQKCIRLSQRLRKAGPRRPYGVSHPKPTRSVSIRRTSRSATDQASRLHNSTRTIVRGVSPRTRNPRHCRASRVNSPSLA